MGWLGNILGGDNAMELPPELLKLMYPQIYGGPAADGPWGPGPQPTPPFLGGQPIQTTPQVSKNLSDAALPEGTGAEGPPDFNKYIQTPEIANAAAGNPEAGAPPPNGPILGDTPRPASPAEVAASQPTVQDQAQEALLRLIPGMTKRDIGPSPELLAKLIPPQEPKWMSFLKGIAPAASGLLQWATTPKQYRRRIPGGVLPFLLAGGIPGAVNAISERRAYPNRVAQVIEGIRRQQVTEEENRLKNATEVYKNARTPEAQNAYGMYQQLVPRVGEAVALATIKRIHRVSGTEGTPAQQTFQANLDEYANSHNGADMPASDQVQLLDRVNQSYGVTPALVNGEPTFVRTPKRGADATATPIVAPPKVPGGPPSVVAPIPKKGAGAAKVSKAAKTEIDTGAAKILAEPDPAKRKRATTNAIASLAARSPDELAYFLSLISKGATATAKAGKK